ncbi:MAG: response regulator [Bdellovibrionales bacterium]
MKILIVDDEAEICDSLGLILKSRGHEITAANNGQKAIDILKNQNFNLVMSDVNMPTMNGVDLLKHVTQNYPDLPMILMTGYAAYKTEDLLALGAKHVLSKPFNSRNLLAAIEMVAQPK